MIIRVGLSDIFSNLCYLYGMLISFQAILEHYQPSITGIIHAGAHTAEEQEEYQHYPVIWIEADPALCVELCKNVNECYCFAAAEQKRIATFYRSTFTAASSLLQPNLNAERRADTATEEEIEVQCYPLSSIQRHQHNFLNLDIQGAELNALQGTDLTQIDYIYTEVHQVETYHNCTRFDEVDDYLTPQGFNLRDYHITKYGWGDAFYTR